MTGGRKWGVPHSSAVSCCLLVVCVMACAVADPACPEPPPVGNALRSWTNGTTAASTSSGSVTYTCFQTYEHTAGDLNRTCDVTSNFTFTGEPPVCTLNCSYTRDETSAYVDSVNSTMALDHSVSSCDNVTAGSGSRGVICSTYLGAWNHSAIDCHGPDNILQSGSGSLTPDPSDPSDLSDPVNSTAADAANSTAADPANSTAIDPQNAIDGNDTSYVTLAPKSSLTFNISSEYGGRVEVTNVTLTLSVTSPDSLPPCRLTRAGTEYTGTLSVVDGQECQRWDSQTPHAHNFTDDSLYPGSGGGVSGAENYCRNPNASQPAPWCYSATAGEGALECNVKACVLLNLHTVYLDRDGVQRAGVCTDQSDPTLSLGVLDRVDEVKPLSVECRNERVSSSTLPFGFQFVITMGATPANVSLNVHEVKANGREYTAGCGPVKGYWGLELVGDAPTWSNVSSKVTYRCSDVMHYRGGPLVSECGDNREWTDPDVSQCTDDPNHAAGQAVSVDPPSVAVAVVVDGNLATCTAAPVSGVNVTLGSPVEVAEVLVTTMGGDTFDMEIEVKTGRDDHWWPCGPGRQVGPGGTFLFTCPFRPVSDTVVLTADPLKVGPDWRLCEVKVTGRVFTKALECLQTEKGGEYKGGWSLTLSGRQCQRWDSHAPHSHGYNVSERFPDVTVGAAADHCRNPLEADLTPSRDRPWCYTTDSETVWEFCPLFFCDDICRLQDDGVGYQGLIDTTGSGAACEEWLDVRDTAEQFHFMRPHYFAGRWWEVGQRCRNPHRSQSLPWCFTARDPVQISPCDIPACPLVGDTEVTYLEPDNSSATPAWLQTDAVKARECWTFQVSDFRVTRRFTAPNTPLEDACSPQLLEVAVFCDLATTTGDTMWHYFYYNCSFPETTLSLTTEMTTQEMTTTEMTTPESTTQGASDGTNDTSGGTCDCVEMCRLNVTQAQVEASVAAIKKELLVDTSQLSATIRKKTSAQDQRTSAITTGYFGVAFFVIVIGLIVCFDLLSIVQWSGNKKPATK